MQLRLSEHTPRISQALWLLTALAVGAATALLPLPTAFTVLILSALVLMSAVTPLVALMAMLTLGPLRTLIATEAPAFRLPLDVGQVALLIFIGAWALQRVVYRLPLVRLRWSVVLWPLIGFLLTVAPGVFIAASVGGWLNEMLKWVQMGVLALLCLSMDEHWEWLVFALVAAGVANALVGIYQFFGGSGALHLLIGELGYRFRAFGTFGQPNPFAGFLGLIAPVAAMAALGYGLRLWQMLRHAWRTGTHTHTIGAWGAWIWQRSTARTALLAMIGYGVAAGVLLFGIVASWSRGSWLAVAASAAVILFALPRRTWIGVVVVFGGMALVGGLWFSGRLPASVVQRISSAVGEYFALSDVRSADINDANYAVVERLAHWQAALNMAQAHPWLGVGLGNYEVVYADYRLMYWEFALGHAHNYYLNILAEAGIIGLSGYLALWVAIIAITWHARAHPDALGRCIAIGLLGSWTYLAFHSLTDNLYVNNVFLHLGVMLGILASLSHVSSHHHEVI
jgi:putative inorganic carbon (hco3(-)) transporter